MRNNKGFGLIELLTVIVIAGLFATLLIRNMGSTLNDVNRAETEREMEMIANAIAGNPETSADGIRSDFGYVGDIGALPPNLEALTVNPGGWPTWNGPYLTVELQENALDYLRDGWDAPYRYSGGIEIVSDGSGTILRRKYAANTGELLNNRFNGLIRDAANNFPGSDYDDSILIEVTIPADSGNSAVKRYNPDSTGQFILDTIPIGKHPLDIIFEPNADTLHRYITIFPRHKTPGQYRFASVLFASDDSTSAPVTNGSIYFSTTGNAEIASVNMDDDDLIEFIPASRSASIYLDGTAIYHQNEDVNAFDILDNGNVLLSSSGNSRIGGLNIGDDDIAEYDSVSGTASIYFNGAVFSNGSENIDAVAVLPNGNIVISTEGNARIGSLSFEDGDLVEYDQGSGNAVLYFDEDNFNGNEDIDAVDVRDDGTILLSTTANATLRGLSFTASDVAAYDPAGDSAWMYFRGFAEFESGSENIDALSVSEAAPRGYQNLVIVRSSVNPGGCDQINFTVENFTGENVTIEGITLTYATSDAYFGKIEWEGDDVFEYSGTRPGSGAYVPFESSKVLNDNSSADIEIKEFRNSPSGGSDVNMDNTVITLEFSDGSTAVVNTGDCE